MAFRVNMREYEILKEIAEYRVLTVRQLAVLYAGNARVLRRKLQEFVRANLIKIGPAMFAGKRGRPEDVFSVSPEGVKLLKSKGNLNAEIPYERVKAITAHSLLHLLLVNDFRIQLVQCQKIVPDLSIVFLSPNSPFTQRCADDKTIIHEHIVLDEAGKKPIRYTPDGVFLMKCEESKKTLLFFLEVDMASESLRSGKGYPGNIQEKITNYQITYQLGRYKRYESVFGGRFQGFRLLFLTSTSARMNQMLQFVVKMPPCEFIHITDQDNLYRQGVWAPIWYKGGRIDQAPVSILGSKMPHPAPAPADIL